MQTIEERFWVRVNKAGPIPEAHPELGPCWAWTRALNHKGYSRFSAKGKSISGHRYSYLLHVGPIPAGLELDHLCRNRKCVNPEHLEAVTHAENLQRSIRALKTHCPHGHEYTPENTIVTVNAKGHTGRNCRTCKNAWNHAYKQRNRVLSALAEARP